MVTETDLQWYYSRDGGQYGPFPFQTLRAMVAGAQLGGNDLVWCDGMAAWLPIVQIELLRSEMPPAAVLAVSDNPLDQLAAAQAPAPYSGQRYDVAYASPGYGYARRQGSSQQGLAIAGFVLSFLFPLLGLIFSLIALSGMKTQRNDEGKGLATAGMIISIVFLALGCLSIAMCGIR